MVRGLEGAEGWSPTVPDEATLPRPLRSEIARVFAAIGQANRFRQRAFAAWPKEMTPQRLLRQAIAGQLQPFEEPDFRRLFPLVEREALMAGMLDLVAAVEDLDHFLAATPGIPAVSWRCRRPWNGCDRHHRGKQSACAGSLLVVDVGGRRLSIHHQNARQQDLRSPGSPETTTTSGRPAADPHRRVAGSLGRGGDDRYEAGTFAQVHCAVRAALLVDGGTDIFTARHAQAFALGGVALVVGMGGDAATAH
jgi:hypothetical protein